MSGDAERKSPAPPTALVASLDADLRAAAFDLLAERGYRVDAVGDAIAVERRLEKDVYDLIVTDGLEIPETPDRTRVVQFDRETLTDRDAWSALVEGDAAPGC